MVAAYLTALRAPKVPARSGTRYRSDLQVRRRRPQSQASTPTDEAGNRLSLTTWKRVNTQLSSGAGADWNKVTCT
jgi:hypothetical protein